ncbi:HAMP domain-containing histidine kinase [Rhizobium leguminosarum]|uniref:sensor histidine kinase n=1 Tax=Rhizobium leguminosarum TaxID=384 RepID=UPI001C94AA61|nr:HAMP domain-containing sensor histidine kinase [Rhizobium leguminosarum]MBY5820465.1 HAMP domain-containing histidine kinase [Rhizobium leguminosarum]
MSLIKDEYWGADINGSSAAKQPSLQSTDDVLQDGTTHDTFRALSAFWLWISGRVVILFPTSMRFRLLLGQIIGPVVAFVSLMILGDAEALRLIIATVAIAGLASLWITAVVVGQTLKPLNDLAEAADKLGISGSVQRLPEYGSCEAATAAKAFNAMSERVSREVEERIGLLTAFSHDIQTPITRMRLRVELADHFPERVKLLRDLQEAERLVRDGIAYAKNSHITYENDTPVELRAFIESIVFDYQDTGRDVSILGRIQGTRLVKPAALRRIMSNLTDNALKFAGAAEISIAETPNRQTVIAVLDRGPGIEKDKLNAVMKPFVRLQGDSGEQVSGVGLGLAIAQQLAREMNASLVLKNREGGGLSAAIVFADR